MTITLNKNTILITLLVVAIAWLGWKVYNGGNDKELDLYKEQYEKSIKDRNDKFNRDSINLVTKYNYELGVRDSALAMANKEQTKQVLIINYYKKKIQNVQTLPIAVVDNELDSLFSRPRHR